MEPSNSKQPSNETLMKILNFFLKTSVPRILAEERKKLLKIK
jgi:hypothetical protein